MAQRFETSAVIAFCAWPCVSRLILRLVIEGRHGPSTLLTGIYQLAWDERDERAGCSRGAATVIAEQRQSVLSPDFRYARPSLIFVGALTVKRFFDFSFARDDR